MAAPSIHGTLRVAGSHHPVLDIEMWKRLAPLGERRRNFGSIESPVDIAIVEQARAMALSGLDVHMFPADLFVWALRRAHEPWLTKLGGVPWLEKGTKWPRDRAGLPLTFLGQISFVDSLGVLPYKPPGDVALFFGRWTNGAVVDEVGGVSQVFMWSDQSLRDPMTSQFDVPHGGILPFEYSGVRHRTVQMLRTPEVEAACEAAGFPDGGHELADVQATQIGVYAGLPQGWPFDVSDGGEDDDAIVCVLSNYTFGGEWPLCDVSHAPPEVYQDGRVVRPSGWHGQSLLLGDEGATYIYRDKRGEYRIDAVDK